MVQELIQEKRLQVSIFMSPLDVHINWAPISGKIIHSQYHPGKYLVAFHPKSSTENEHHSTAIQHNNGTVILFRQIAGAMARRVVNYATIGANVDQAQEIGFIKFGSRVDIFLPLEVKLNIKIGDKIKRWT